MENNTKTMSANTLHQSHPTDARRTVGGHFRTACGRWAKGAAFHSQDHKAPCAKCAVAELIALTSTEDGQ